MQPQNMRLKLLTDAVSYQKELSPQIH